MEKVDVVILTKDSDDLLRTCLNSVYENIPVNRLIAVDGHSSDDTLKILEEYEGKYGNIRILEEEGTRGKARGTGIRAVETDWFVFVDSDVVLSEDWFLKATKQMAPDVGAIWGVDIPGSATNKLIVSALLRMESRVFDLRGGCHDLLVRTEAVRDIRIPNHLHTMEDAYIRDWILSKNYRVVKSFSALCRHYKTWDSMLSKQSIRSSVHELGDARAARERWIYNVFYALMWMLYGIQSRAESKPPK